MRSRSDLYSIIRLPSRTPRHEQLHEDSRHTSSARRSTRGVVCPTDRATEGEGEKSESRPSSRRLYARVVGVAGAREVVETEGDGEEGGEDTWTCSEGSTEGSIR